MCHVKHLGRLASTMTIAVMIVSLFVGVVLGAGLVLWWGARSIARAGR